LRRSDTLLNAGQLGIYVENTIEKFEMLVTAFNRGTRLIEGMKSNSVLTR